MSLYKLTEKIFEMEKQGKKILRLNIGDPGLPTPEIMTQAAEEAIRQGKTRYSSGQGEQNILEEIARLHAADSKNVVVTPGSKWACYSLMKSLLAKGDNIVTPTPFWSAFELMAQDLGASTKKIPTRLEDKWQFEPEKLFSEMDANTKLVVINNPLNPTSTEYGKNVVQEVIHHCQKKKVTVLIDEAYRDLSFKDNSLTQLQEGVAVTNTFSKAYCMSGWRLGYIVADAETAKKIVSLNQITFTNVPSFTQSAGLEGLKNRAAITKATRQECANRLSSAEKIFSGVEYAKSDAGFYLFLKCHDSEKTAEKILEKGIAVTPGTVFGGYENFIRISLTQPLELLTPALKIIEEEIR